MDLKSWSLRLLSLSIFTIALAASLETLADEECQAQCPGGASDKVVVNLQDKCMCIGEGKCFKVDIGKDGPSMTSDGAPSEKLEGCKGDKYSEQARPNNGYDKDCLKMGIPGNDSVGKWIHKTGSCGDGGNNATLGCIGVPCAHWTELIDEAKGKKSVVVCGGNKDGGSATTPPNHSGEEETQAPRGGDR